MRRFAIFTGDSVTDADRCRAINRAAAEQLLGPLTSHRVGGDVEAEIARMRGHLEEQSSLLRAARQKLRILVCAFGSSDRDADSMRREVAIRQDQQQRIDRKICTLKAAAAQLKALLTPDGAWIGNCAVRRKAAARLALIGFCMHEVPVLTCASGRHLVEPVESEVQFLAAVAASAEGRLPKVDLDLRFWRDARAAFEPPLPDTESRGRLPDGCPQPDAAPCRVMNLSMAGHLARSGKARFNVEFRRENLSPESARRSVSEGASPGSQTPESVVTLALD